jgi:RND family efflux transporter MFP subunit
MHESDFLKIVFICSLIAVFPLGCEKEKPEQVKVLRPVRFQKVVVTSHSRVRTFAGTAKAGEEARLSFKVPGTISRLYVKVGDSVEPGDILVELDPNDYALEVQKAEASLARAHAQARNATADYSRTRDLFENNNASREDLDAARAADESGKASVRAATKELEIARLQLSYTRLYAHTKGAIAEVPVEVNENVRAGKPVAHLYSGGPPEVEVAIPEAYVAQIKRGNAVTVTFDALPGKEFAATVTKVGVGATGGATTFPVTALLKEPDPTIRSGLAANMTFTFGSRNNRPLIVVPMQAVGEDRNGRFVFLLERKGQGRDVVRRRSVSVGGVAPTDCRLLGTLGSQKCEGLEVLEGLEDGELVVTAGVKRLKDGDEVKVLDRKND